MGMKQWKLWLTAEPVEVPLVGEMPRGDFEAIIAESFEDADSALQESLRDWASTAELVAYGVWRAKCGALKCACPVGSVSDFLSPYDDRDQADHDAERAAHDAFSDFDQAMAERYVNSTNGEPIYRGVVHITD